MATISASLEHAALIQKASVVRHSSILGLPSMAKIGKVRCYMEGKPQESDSILGIGASLMAAAACIATMSGPAMALSTEGTGLPFGLSNNLLGWILLGVFALIWSLYTVYTSTLEEDEDSGLSL